MTACRLSYTDFIKRRWDRKEEKLCPANSDPVKHSCLCPDWTEGQVVQLEVSHAKRNKASACEYPQNIWEAATHCDGQEPCYGFSKRPHPLNHSTNDKRWFLFCSLEESDIRLTS